MKIKMSFFLVQITILQLKNRGFQQLKQFMTDSIDDRMKIKAEITSFNTRYYMNLIKLRLRLRVATIKNASCARLRVRRDFGLRSCGCGNSK